MRNESPIIVSYDDQFKYVTNKNLTILKNEKTLKIVTKIIHGIVKRNQELHGFHQH